MRVRVLGSAAGGGLPQWNCSCRVCAAARSGDGAAVPRTQSSIAVSGDDGRWFLVNASPDLRAQLELLPRPADGEARFSPVEAVLLTDGEIDHTAGLLLLREAGTPLRVFSTAEVRDALSEDYPILRMLDSYSGVEWRELRPGATVALDDSGLEVEAFPAGGDPPLYLRDETAEIGAIGLTIVDRGSGTTLTYVPGLATLDDDVVERLTASDCVLVDGTFWEDDELVRLGAGTRRAADMGHLPLAPPDGTLPFLAGLDARTVLVHVNNTNPILLEASPERAAVEAAGVEVGYDGMEIELG